MSRQAPPPQNDTYGKRDLDPMVVAHRLEEAGKDWAEKKHAADLLTKTEKAVLSELTNKIRRDHPGMSRREAEDIARGSPEFRDHLHAMSDAVRDANIARAKYDAERAKFEAMRTNEATKRAEMSLR